MSKTNKAIAYMLDQIQINPDLRYYAGPGTEVFRLLCAAEAEIRGKTESEVEGVRSLDLQPSYSRRSPEVVYLRRLVGSEK
jgi:hypothetical protein